MDYRVIYSDSLSHHGILGQKWGKRNGPPYPLDANDHSASEKKAGWRKSLDSAGSRVSKNVKDIYNEGYKHGSNTNNSALGRVAMNTIKASLTVSGMNIATNMFVLPLATVLGPAAVGAVIAGNAAVDAIVAGQYLINDAGVIIGRIDKNTK